MVTVVKLISISKGVERLLLVDYTRTVFEKVKGTLMDSIIKGCLNRFVLNGSADKKCIDYILGYSKCYY